MDWYPTLATLAGIRVPDGRVIDGRDISPLLTGKSDTVPPASQNTALNGRVPLRRPWRPAGEWQPIVTRDEYERAFFYHGSHGALAAVRLDQWKLTLHPTLALYDLEEDPGERKLVRNGAIVRKLRGMAVMFQEEMSRDARPAGRVEDR
jgi:arylsulfatase A-like enzyme